MQEPQRQKHRLSQDRVEHCSCFLSSCCANSSISLFMLPVQFIVLLLLPRRDSQTVSHGMTPELHGKPGWKSQFLLRHVDVSVWSWGCRNQEQITPGGQKCWVKAGDEEFVGVCAEIQPERRGETLLECIYPAWCHLILQNPSEHLRSRAWVLLKTLFLLQHHHSHLPPVQLFLIQQLLSSRPHKPDGRGWEVCRADP